MNNDFNEFRWALDVATVEHNAATSRAVFAVLGAAFHQFAAAIADMKVPPGTPAEFRRGVEYTKKEVAEAARRAAATWTRPHP